MLSLGVLCWSLVAWLELAALGFRGEGFRRYLCYRLSLRLAFVFPLLLRVVEDERRFLGVDSALLRRNIGARAVVEAYAGLPIQWNKNS